MLYTCNHPRWSISFIINTICREIHVLSNAWVSQPTSSRQETISIRTRLSYDNIDFHWTHHLWPWKLLREIGQHCAEFVQWRMRICSPKTATVHVLVVVNLFIVLLLLSVRFQMDLNARIPEPRKSRTMWRNHISTIKIASSLVVYFLLQPKPRLLKSRSARRFSLIPIPSTSWTNWPLSKHPHLLSGIVFSV